MIGGGVILLLCSIPWSKSQQLLTNCHKELNNSWRLNTKDGLPIRMFINSFTFTTAKSARKNEDLIYKLDGLFRQVTIVRAKNGISWTKHGFQPQDGWLYDDPKNGHTVFVYPDFRTGILGEFNSIGELTQGQPVKITHFRCALNILEITTSQPKESSPKLHYEKMTSFSAGSQPTVMDPMERKNVYIASTNMGEGMFAKMDLFPFQLICYYSGLFISHEDAKGLFSNMSLDELKVASRYLVNFNDTHILDVPSGDLAKFRSSLGHKINHSFRPNSRFVYAQSPRFGNVTAIEALSFVKRGDEILISYGYQNLSSPTLEWYKKLQMDSVSQNGSISEFSLRH